MNSFICGHYIKKRARCEAVCCRGPMPPPFTVPFLVGEPLRYPAGSKSCRICR
jgi:hypothetical protein